MFCDFLARNSCLKEKQKFTFIANPREKPNNNNNKLPFIKSGIKGRTGGCNLPTAAL